jgi:putative SOS response-associated peptidase YedK
MCGRFTLIANPETLISTFVLDAALSPALNDLMPRYNVAPSQPVAAIVGSDDGRVLELMKWGLVPSWSKDPKIGYKMINARAETVAEKASFKAALKKRRCLIPADGFYEWKKSEGKNKTPMYIQMESGEPFAFAGLYEFWKAPEEDTWLKSCTIITTTPNSLMETIHDRMPAILKPGDYDQWLDPAQQGMEAVMPLLAPFDASQMKAFAVSTMVNSPAYDGPGCIQPA